VRALAGVARRLAAPAAAVHDLYEVLRRAEAAQPGAPRIGRSLRLMQDVVRLGQAVSLAFPAGSLAAYEAGEPGEPWRVRVHGFGLLGPNGPLPLHMTEYVLQRIQHHADHALASFLDLFHHRMLAFLYRAWVDANPAVSSDRPDSDRFQAYLGALLGIGTPALRERDALGDACRRHYVGRFADPVANPEGLCALIEHVFGLPARVEEFVAEWCDIPDSCLWRLQSPAVPNAAHGGSSGALGLSTQLGRRVWLAQGKFRVVLGPLTRHQFDRVSQGGAELPRLIALIRGYAGDALRWDLRLQLRPDAVPTLQLGTARLGQSAWLWSIGALPQDDLIFDPRLSRHTPAG
jgi:type VI secretion system protein ImpH